MWSDPSQEENNELSQTKIAYGVKNAVKFGPDRLKDFLKENNLTMMVRSHECVADGFERIWNGLLTTVFSATDYCGKFTNLAAVIVFRKNLEVTPKVIYPLSGTPGGTGNQFQVMDEEKSIENSSTLMKNGTKNMGYSTTLGNQYENAGNSNWIDNEESLKKRPANSSKVELERNV